MNVSFCTWRRTAWRALFGTLLLATSACNIDVVNPNAATDVQTLSTREGVFASASGYGSSTPCRPWSPFF
ncbi:hypothetical protein [Hymenobacter sp. AT01-02]|uniref:hypothetical protein n=1 Tax=Hymenobacter sp. AT01-02 TaxID=1571877 RepID=UPI000AEA337F|nr:hypothetical protein [Hymenobacter sp. AT01-02]